MVAQNASQVETVVSKIIAMAWLDGEFYNRLASNAAEVLREAGVIIDGVADIIVKHDSEMPGLRPAAEGAYELCLPARPADIADEKLHSNVQGGPPPTFCAPCSPTYC